MLHPRLSSIWHSCTSYSNKNIHIEFSLFIIISITLILVTGTFQQHRCVIAQVRNKILSIIPLHTARICQFTRHKAVKCIDDVSNLSLE